HHRAEVHPGCREHARLDENDVRHRQEGHCPPRSSATAVVPCSRSRKNRSSTAPTTPDRAVAPSPITSSEARSPSLPQLGPFRRPGTWLPARRNSVLDDSYLCRQYHHTFVTE